MNEFEHANDLYQQMLRDQGKVQISPAALCDARALGLDIEAAGLSYEVSEPSEGDTIACASGSLYHFPDNVFTVCAECGACIQHRPHVPAVVEKICYNCASKRLAAEAAASPDRQ